MVEKIINSYNPFRMLGSWCGLGVFISLSIIAVVGGGNEFFGIDEMKYLSFFVDLDFINQLFNQNCSGDSCLAFILTTPIVFSFYGFLVGWGIHSLFLKYKR